jgi:DNA-binding HxlR family transcriptional regulator
MISDCPVRAAIDVIGGKWKPVIIYHLMSGKKRHSEFRKLMADASQKMLTQQLRELERDGIVLRTIFPEKTPRVEYELSQHGKTLQPVMTELCKWGKAQAKFHR